MKKFNLNTTITITPKKLILRCLILLILNNIFVFLLFYNHHEPTGPSFSMPNHFSELQIQAESKVPFKKNTYVKLTNQHQSIKPINAILIEQITSDEGIEFQVAISKEDILKVLSLKKIMIIPAKTQQKISIKEKENYEIHF